MLLSILLWGCEQETEHHQSQDNKTIATPTTIVNLRTGPGKGYKIVKGLHPGENLNIEEKEYGDWVLVSTDDGQSGYVASEYIKIISFRNVIDNVETNTTNIPDMDLKKSGMSGSDVRSFFTRYMDFMTSTGGFVVTGCILFLQILLIQYFRNKYDYMLTGIRELTQTRPAVLAIIVSLFLTIFQSIAIFLTRHGASALDFYYILMLLSTGLVMAVVPWRIRMSGLKKHSQHFSYKGDSRASWATKLGAWTWSILLIPIAIIFIQHSGYGNHKIFDNSSFWSMLISMSVFTLIAWLFCRFFWTYVIIKHLLTSMNSTILGIFNIVLIIGIARYEYFACDESFSGINYAVSLYLLVLSVIIYGGAMLKTVNEKRCSNCHSFDGQYSHTTDLGHSDYTYREWESCGDSNIRPKHRDAIISDAQRLVSTTKRTHKWKTHHVCPDCDNKWEIEDQSNETVDSHTVKRSWKETYIE